MTHIRLISVVLPFAFAFVAACTSGDEPAASGGTAPAGNDGESVTLRLGYFPNLTHATALAGVESGIFQRNLGENVTLKTSSFNAGPAAVEAIFSDALDAAYIGPNPAINAYVRSKGDAVRVIAGAVSGGAYLVVKPEIGDVAALKGKKVATPQLGNTQDVALRSWLAEQGLKTDPQGGGDVRIVPQENAQTFEAFRAGQIAGAWVPEPWATRLLMEGGGKVLVDERTLWPNGAYVTTHLIVRTAFLKKYPDVVERLLRGQVETNALLNANPAAAQKLTNTAIEQLTGRGLAPETIIAAWNNLTFTNDPIAASLKQSARDAERLGFLNLSGINLDGIYDLTLLNNVLKATGNAAILSQ